MQVVTITRTLLFIQHFFSTSKSKLLCLINYLLHVLERLLFRVNHFWIELAYFLFLSVIGYAALKICNTKATALDLDMFFMSVSAATASSMSTMEMEALSNLQLIVLAVLMLAGGEVFSSMIGLQLLKLKSDRHTKAETEVDVTNFVQEIQDGVPSHCQVMDIENSDLTSAKLMEEDLEIRCKAMEFLLYVVLCYLLVAHLAGFGLVYAYVSLISSAQRVLAEKRINLITFSVFMATSTFANGGFVPTNENMMAFKRNSGLLLILIPQALMGNTLYPACLRVAIWLLERRTKRAVFGYILRNTRDLGYNHMFSSCHTKFLVYTTLGFIIVPLVCFCALEWDSEATKGLNSYEKIVGSLFQVINSRHAGESAFDLSAISPPILLLFVVMMYLPPYTCFLPYKEEDCILRKNENMTKYKNKSAIAYFWFSPLGYLVVFVILICITERNKLREDPLNFNLLSIILEVISAYGNVGFSMGYSCQKQINPRGHCKDASYGFVGRWSNPGKLVLIIVMFCGKLKKFSINGGQAWRFS